MICERFETVVVPFPFAEKIAIKRRPAVVVSGPAFNQKNGSTIVAMVTTAKAIQWPSDLLIQDQHAAGLSTPCVIRLRLVTLPNDLLLRKVGALGAPDRQALDQQLASIGD